MGGGKRLFIGGLSRDARTSDVEKHFNRYGDLRDVRVMDGFGFVVSFRSESGVSALALAAYRRMDIAEMKCL